MKKSIYTTPKVCRSEKGWYVWFRYSGSLKRYKLGINYIKNISEREKQANALVAALLLKLKKGWNPLVPELPQLGEDLTLMDALNFCLDQKKQTLSSKSISGYKGTVKFSNASIDRLDLNMLKIHDVKRAHIRTIIDESRQFYKWSNKNRNKHLNHLKALMSELIEHDILENNPAHKIKNLGVVESRANTPATDDEHDKIKNCLSDNHPNFFNFIKTIYYTGARPKELLSVKLEMISLKHREIILPAEITKLRKSDRTVIIDDGLLEVLLEMEIEKYPKDFYLFGSFRTSGRGNVGKYLDFIPGPTPLKRDTATKRWKRIIKDGLGIDVNMYSYKHKGGNDKLRAGVDLDSIRNQYGHSNKKMTKTYVKEITGFYKDDIIRNSTEF